MRSSLHEQDAEFRIAGVPETARPLLRSSGSRRGPLVRELRGVRDSGG